MLRPAPNIWGAAAWILAVVLSLLSSAAAADDVVRAVGQGDDDAPPAPPWREVWAGAEVVKHSWSAYSDVAVAPFGSIVEDGWRLRSVGGYGRYRYEGTRRIGGRDTPTTFQGTTSFTDLMLGYRLTLGPATLKAYAGGAAINHQVWPYDGGNQTTGLDYGFKGALEAWFNIASQAWTSHNGEWTTAHDTFAVRSKIGWRLLPDLSLGLEGGLMGNSSYDGGRGGGFLRHEWETGEISLSGGVTGDRAAPSDPYAAINWLSRF